MEAKNEQSVCLLILRDGTQVFIILFVFNLKTILSVSRIEVTQMFAL